MSLETWKKIYYPIPASEVPADQAVAHSLQKWHGLRLAVLKEHGVECRHEKMIVRDENSGLRIDGGSCAMCIHYSVSYPRCLDCPLYRHVGDRCDSQRNSPYQVWVHTGDPKSMIAALEACLKKEAPHAP